MNFLLHRHLAARDLGSEVAAIGAMLPDLWRMANRRVRARPGLTTHQPRGVPPGGVGRPARGSIAHTMPSSRPPIGAPPETVVAAAFDSESSDDAQPTQLALLLLGVEHHLATDAWFHHSPSLERGEAEAMRYLREQDLATDKMLLLAHVAWELCLDGALLRRFGLDPVLQTLRSGLEEIDPVNLTATVSLHHPAFDKDEETSKRFAERMNKLLEELAAGDWIKGYQTGEGVAQRLAGVRRRLRLQSLDEDRQQRLTGVLDRLLNSAEHELEVLLAAAKRQRRR